MRRASTPRTRRPIPSSAFGLALVALAACSASTAPPGAAPPKLSEETVISDIDQRLAKYSPVPLAPDLSALSARDRQALDKLNEVSRLIDEIYLR